MNIACFDAFYYDNYAIGSCIVFDENENILNKYNMRIESIEEYIPGQFYKRELPCIINLFSRIKEKMDLIIIDSFIYVDNVHKGLGEYLYDALNKEIPIIGVAKNPYLDATNYKNVYRGKSKTPLYVSAIGYDLNKAADYIHNLQGEFRIPTILKKVDQLSRK
jgi:deoxyribonuclease V